jgi:hypothetical protein
MKEGIHYFIGGPWGRVISKAVRMVGASVVGLDREMREPNFLAVCAFSLLGLLLSHRAWLIFPGMPEVMALL